MSLLKRFQQSLILSILFLLPLYFVKLRYAWLSLNLVEVLIIILFFIWIINKNIKYRRLDAGYKISVILMLIGLLLSTIANRNYYVGLGIIKGWFILPIIFSVVLYDCLKKDFGLLDKIFAALFASGVLVSIIGIYYKFSGFLTYDGRLRAFYDSPNQLAMFLAPVFLIGVIKFGFEELPRFYRGKGKAELWKNGLKVVGILLMSFNLYLTKSYGAWLSVGAVLAVIFWLKYRALLNKKYFSLLLIILIIIFGWAGFVKYKNIEKLGERSSLASRVMIWKSAGLIIKNNLLFGVGPGNFQNRYLEYQKYFPPYLEWSVPQPHNLFLAFWLEAGLAGLFGFILLLIQFFKDNKKAILYNRSYGILCLALVLYFLFHGLIDTTYWRNDMAVIFWLVISVNLYLALGKDEEAERKGNP
jgi:putative inorganic carbon (hco3(-)) transporter